MTFLIVGAGILGGIVSLAFIIGVAFYEPWAMVIALLVCWSIWKGILASEKRADERKQQQQRQAWEHHRRQQMQQHPSYRPMQTNTAPYTRNSLDDPEEAF
jgi:choline-glycine betaine transporter